MNALRGVFAALLLALVTLPLVVPLREVRDPAAWTWSADDGARLIWLGVNTLLLAAGTTALALPLGLTLAVLLFRTNFIARRSLLFLLLFLLFVPLPIVVSSWQALLGVNGWLPIDGWRSGDGRPWATGWGPAIWIHTLAAVPWVACIIGLGLSWVEPEAEDEAATCVGPWRVLLFVTLPRARASLLAATLFVVLQTAGEISVTDMMLISTLAEETHTQFTLGDNTALTRTLIVALPGLLVAWLCILGMVAYLEKSLPPLTPPTRAPRGLELGTARLRLALGVLWFAMLTVPLCSLGWKVGLSGHPQHWSLSVAWHFLHAEAVLLGGDLAATLATSAVAGFLTAGIALAGCWLARDCRWLRGLLFSVLAWAWVLPGPTVGIGLHTLIVALCHQADGPWTTLLYFGPSPVPIVWAQTIRALPAAVVFLWPIVRMIPRELIEAARMEGAAPTAMLLHVVLPMTWRGVCVTGLAASALCLGEVAASARVETPGWESFTKMLFGRMHYGVENNVSALALLLLTSIAGLALTLTFVRPMLGRKQKHRPATKPETR